MKKIVSGWIGEGYFRLLKSVAQGRKDKIFLLISSCCCWIYSSVVSRHDSAFLCRMTRRTMRRTCRTTHRTICRTTAFRVATSYRTTTSNGTSYRTKSSYKCKIHSYDGRNGHKLSYEFRTMPSYCVRSYDSLWRFRRTFTLILRSYDRLWGRRTFVR